MKSIKSQILENRWPLYSFLFMNLCIATAYSSSIPQAIELAKSGLKSTIVEVQSEIEKSTTRYYLVAGANQYRSLWAWDFAFASIGAYKAGYEAAVNDSLRIYFDNQREDGFLPRVIDNHPLELRVPLGIVGINLDFKEPLKAQYKTENGVISFVPNAMLSWTASRYIELSQDKEFAERYFSHAEKAIEWLDKNTLVDGLICKQEPYSDWEDSVQRTGCVSFTNILFGYSLRGLAQWAQFIGKTEKQKFYQDRYQQFVTQFKAYFWDESKQVFKNFTGDDHLTADTNLLAVAYGLVDQNQGALIMNALRSSPLWVPYPGRPTWPNYAKSIKSFYPRMVGLVGYHDEIRWGWLTSLAAIAEKEVGRPDLAMEILEVYSKQVITDQGVYEVYDYNEDKKSMLPVRRLFYESEKPFTWGSGLFLEAALP